MKLNEKSVTSKLYRWFYGTQSMPTNLCPYFWKLVVMWIFIVPMSILAITNTFIYKLSKGELGADSHEDIWGKFSYGIVFYLVIYIASCMIIALSYLFIGYENGTALFTLSAIGFVFWFFWIVGFIALFIKDMTDNDHNDGVVKGFVKAKYNKYCPTIEWSKK